MGDDWDDDDIDDAPADEAGHSDLAALDVDWSSVGADLGAAPDDRVDTLLFTVANPPGSVAATVLINGRVDHVELGPSVTKMTEAQLAEEITLLATLARQKAQAAQHAITAQLMGELGHDSVATAGFLRREIGLPSPDDYRATVDSVFRSRYVDDDHDD